MKHDPKIRLVITPVSHETGQRRDGPVYVYTWPQRLHKNRVNRWVRLNADLDWMTTPAGYARFDLKVMSADYWQGHKPQGDVRHLGDVHKPFVPMEDANAGNT